MLDKEIAELRRRFRYEKNNIGALCGCYVNEKKEIVTTFRQSLPMMGQEEAERYLALFRRAFTGTMGKNLLDVSFTNEQVTSGEEHKLLSTLRETKLADEEAVNALFGKIIATLEPESNYLILLTQDVYDVPSYGKDGAKSEDGSETMFSYILCCVCPVKLTKPSLRYDSFRSLFQSRDADQIVSTPEVGFLFPAFDDRCANLYGALYAAKNLKDNHPELANALFGTPLPMPAAEQKETFRELLADALEEECSYDVVQTVQDTLLARVLEQKENPEEPVPPVTREDLREALAACGVSEEKLQRFDAQYEEAFGENGTLPPQNLTGGSKTEFRTEDVLVRVDASRSDLVQVKLLDGKPCLVIRAEGMLTVNGVPVSIHNDKKHTNKESIPV